MKVIANSDQDTVLCSVTLQELAIIAGYTSTYDKGWKTATEKYRDRYGSPASYVGLEIAPLVVSRFHATVGENERKALDCATTLRALADLITRSLPQSIICPEPKDDTETEAA